MSGYENLQHEKLTQTTTPKTHYPGQHVTRAGGKRKKRDPKISLMDVQLQQRH